MTTYYNKLVRDRIPEIIRDHGAHCTTTTLDQAQYQQALRAKLCEEAQEVLSAEDSTLLTELADVFEVLDALLIAYSIDPADVRAQQAQRHAQRGGFTQRLCLLSTSPYPATTEAPDDLS